MVTMWTIALVLLLTRSSLANPVNSGLDCPTLMYSEHMAAIPPSFSGVVAHGVHSLTIPDIHYYFPNNNSDIRMPVVNPDLLSLEPILFKPPDFKHTFDRYSFRDIYLTFSQWSLYSFDVLECTQITFLLQPSYACCRQSTKSYEFSELRYEVVYRSGKVGPRCSHARCVAGSCHGL